jgi:hypothetical protein
VGIETNQPGFGGGTETGKQLKEKKEKRLGI